MDTSELKVLIKKIGISQQTLSELAQCSQAHVSRILKMGSEQNNPKYNLIANYVRNRANQTAEDEAIHPAIKKAVMGIWDGSEIQAKKIAEVINGLRGFCE